jgi:metal-dependent amidase/aminoacylase/carboxypeptidase family protein
MPSKDTAREAAFFAIRDARDEVVRACRDLHAGRARKDDIAPADRIVSLLEQHGFSIERDVEGVVGTFRATKLNHHAESMRKGLRHGTVGYLLEVDDSPDGGREWGYNLIAGVPVAAAIGLAGSFVDVHGTVIVYGGPKGYREKLAATGVFRSLDAALGARPAPPGEGFCYITDNTGDRLGSLTVTVTFAGTNAESQRDALLAGLDGLSETLGEQQSITPGTSESSGSGEEARVSSAFIIKAESRSELIEISVRLKDRADEIAGNGQEVDLAFANAIDDMIVSRILARRVKTYGDNLDLRMDKIVKSPPGEPSDWGNVSYIVPAYEAALSFTTEPVTPGTPAFAAAANTDEAYEQMIRLAECLAFTGLDILRNMTYRAIADDQLVKTLAKRGIASNHRRWLGVHPVQPSPNDKKRGPRLKDFRQVRGPGMPEPPDDEEE